MIQFPFRPFRLSSLALAGALLFALGGIYAIDRTLSQTARTEAAMQASESASLVQGFLALHAEALQSLRGIYLDTTHSQEEEYFQAIVQPLTEYASQFRRIWTTDSAGIVRHQFLVDDPVTPIPADLDVDTLTSLRLGEVTDRARRTRRIQVSRPGSLFGDEPGLVIIVPMFTGERFTGFAAGSVTSTSVLGVVRRGRLASDTVGITILAGDDTVARAHDVADGQSMPLRARASFRAPGGERWSVTVVHSTPGNRIRLLLWSVGLATLGALILSLIHERRQGVRLAERSQELERLSLELLRANQSKSEFLANVSHELRTPLNAIVGFAELLKDGVYGDLAPRQTSPVDRIAASANHLRYLVDQILDIAKMAAGRLEVHLEPVDLRPLIHDVTNELEALISERGLNMSLSMEGALPRVRSDPVHLRQILLNLLANAIKFTVSGGIEVSTRILKDTETQSTRDGVQPVSWIAVDVADSGIGIAPADMQRIFEEFEQVGAGSRGNSAQRGTGLGLAISRRLAQLLGGNLTVESEVGKGSTFTLWVPVMEE
ncbi:MAG: ATP-binding protein [Gemmatimonadaceae bacterium]